MTIAQLEKRIAVLEDTVDRLTSLLETTLAQTQRHWWRDDAGAFANDPGFEEMVRLGREYRESLHPDRRKRRKQQAKNARS